MRCSWGFLYSVDRCAQKLEGGDPMVNTHEPQDSGDVTLRLRRLALLQKVGVFGPLPHGVTLKRATSVEEYRDALALVHQSYVDQAFIVPRSSGLRVRPWETFPRNGLFICKTDEKVVGVTGAVMDNADILLPSDNAFHQELNRIREKGGVICEISNQAIAVEYRNTPVVTELMRATYGHAWFSDVTDLVCAVSPKQRHFFSLVGFRQVGEIKSYSDVVFDPVVFLHLENVANRFNADQPEHPIIREFYNRFLFTENPYIPVLPLWQRMVDMLFADPARVEALFQGCDELFTNRSVQENAAMEHNLGVAYHNLLAKVNRDHKERTAP
jgi:hypothetical protein